MIIQIIRLNSGMTEEELMRVAKVRVPQFEAIPGLMQKYYVKMEQPGRFAGVYVWDSIESLKSFRASDLAASIPEAYALVEAPTIEVGDVLFRLRES